MNTSWQQLHKLTPVWAMSWAYLRKTVPMAVIPL